MLVDFLTKPQEGELQSGMLDANKVICLQIHTRSMIAVSLTGSHFMYPVSGSGLLCFAMIACCMCID